MELLRVLISFLDKNFNLLLLWLYNKKVDENIKLETDMKFIKEETEIKSKEEKMEEATKDSENKILAFRRKLKEFKGK